MMIESGEVVFGKWGRRSIVTPRILPGVVEASLSHSDLSRTQIADHTFRFMGWEGMLLFPYAPHRCLALTRFGSGPSHKLLLSHVSVAAGLLLTTLPSSAQTQAAASPPNAAKGSVAAQFEEPGISKSGAKADPDAESKSRTSKRSIVVSGLLHTWYGNGLGDTLGGAGPGLPPPQGRNYGTGGLDALRFRRAQVALSGSPADRIDYRVMLDFAPSDLLQDFWVGYQVGRHARLELGRQKTGLSEEGSRPDDQLLTIARSVINEDLPVTAGRVGDVRSTGTALRFRFTDVRGFVGLWNRLGDTEGLSFSGGRKFLDGAVYLDVVPHLTLGVWGGRNVGGKGAVEDRERSGITLLYRNGRHFFEGEVAYTRDYAAGAPAPGRTGSLGRGGFLLYGYRLTPQWQVVGRYDNWDPAKQTVFTGVATTESGIPIPRSNHKLREYTFGVNYTVPRRDARVQFNYVREDTEENGSGFFGVPRSLIFLNLQVGYDSPHVSNREPEKYDLPTASHRKAYALQNAIRLGFMVDPRLGLALGADFTLPKVKLLPYAETRLSADLLAPFDVPTFLGLPKTQATATLDQVFAFRPHSRGLYGGFGIGPSFGLKARIGGKLFLGESLSSALALELTAHFTGLPAPRYTLQVRFPL